MAKKVLVLCLPAPLSVRVLPPYHLLLRADGVTHEAISHPVWQQTRRQMERETGVLLLVHDGTEMDYGYRPAIKGLGPIGNGSHRGFSSEKAAFLPTFKAHPASVRGCRSTW